MPNGQFPADFGFFIDGIQKAMSRVTSLIEWLPLLCREPVAGCRWPSPCLPSPWAGPSRLSRPLWAWDWHLLLPLRLQKVRRLHRHLRLWRCIATGIAATAATSIRLPEHVQAVVVTTPAHQPGWILQR